MLKAGIYGGGKKCSVSSSIDSTNESLVFHSSEIGAFINLMLTADECELFCHGRQTTPAEELIPNEGLEQLPVKMLYIRSLAETHQRGLSWQRLMTLIPLSDTGKVTNGVTNPHCN